MLSKRYHYRRQQMYLNSNDYYQEPTYQDEEQDLMYPYDYYVHVYFPPNSIHFSSYFVLQKQAENTEQNHAEQNAVVDPECLIKHPLQFTWTLWYQEPDRSKSWEDTLNEVTSFSTVEDFWSLFNHIKSPADIKVGSDYSLFKTGIRPMWEDDGNKRGGRWMVNVPRQQRQDLDKYWLDTVCLPFKKLISILI